MPPVTTLPPPQPPPESSIPRRFQIWTIFFYLFIRIDINGFGRFRWGTGAERFSEKYSLLHGRRGWVRPVWVAEHTDRWLRLGHHARRAKRAVRFEYNFSSKHFTSVALRGNNRNNLKMMRIIMQIVKTM